ncbi:nitrilase [Thiocapsa imhoffii]|uniref:Nitrilase n=1 Tax=Thiocapsa imhoffii TaxID=382777 RepID=A0A9X1BAP5_9GAMM|nr:carbon-nitrogen hydrolase family protein [Thiocapsa imhoffii]MBK1646398.1 nitrilase [Thiocapsa imhoffii]
MIITTHIKTTAPAFGEGIRLAIVQATGSAGTPEAIRDNLRQLAASTALACAHEAQLVAFPELYLSGYAVPPDRLHALAMDTTAAPLQEVAAIAAEQRVGIICPYPERARVAGEIHYYDAIALFGPDGTLLKNYRKTHLWGPDEKLIWSAGYREPEEGPAFTVHEVNGFPIGLLNCYEAEFPELTRQLALAGARLVVIPTAADESTKLSTGKWTSPPYPDVSKLIIPANAWMNHCFVAYCNRCLGETLDGELVGRYLGNSVVASPHGELLVAARNEPTLLLVDCVPGDFGPTHPESTNYHQDRRPELY